MCTDPRQSVFRVTFHEFIFFIRPRVFEGGNVGTKDTSGQLIYRDNLYTPDNRTTLSTPTPRNQFPDFGSPKVLYKDLILLILFPIPPLKVEIGLWRRK